VGALSVAGVPTDRFTFEGFLPAKAAARCRLLRERAGLDQTLVFYEAPHRLLAALKDLQEVAGADRQLVVVRELTKLHEEVFRGSVAEALAHFGQGSVKGELVLILPPAEAAPKVSMSVALRKLLEESDLPRRQVVKIIAKEYGVPGSDVYRESLKFLDDKE